MRYCVDPGEGRSVDIQEYLWEAEGRVDARCAAVTLANGQSGRAKITRGNREAGSLSVIFRGFIDEMNACRFIVCTHHIVFRRSFTVQLCLYPQYIGLYINCPQNASLINSLDDAWH